MSQDVYALAATKGQETSLTITASCVKLAWNLEGTLPDGLDFSIQDNSALIKGTPASGTTGTHEVTVTATNEGGTASAHITITITGTESIDVVAGDPTTTATGNGGSTTSAQTAFRTVSGQDDEYGYTLEISGLPEWLSAEGELEASGTLVAGETEKHHSFTLSAIPSGESSQTVSFTAKVSVSGLEASLGKEVHFSAVEPEVEVNGVLEALQVEIFGGDEVAADFGSAESLTLAASVQGTFSDGNIKTLAPEEYELTWETNEIEDLSISDGILSVSEATPARTYDVTITATVTSGEITASATKTVSVSVIADTSAAPVLACATPNITLNVGAVLDGLSVVASVVPESWNHSGELPDGLSYAENGSMFTIRRTVSVAAETRDYTFTVSATNEAG